MSYIAKLKASRAVYVIATIGAAVVASGAGVKLR